jgi:hypothetical protein
MRNAPSIPVSALGPPIPARGPLRSIARMFGPPAKPTRAAATGCPFSSTIFPEMLAAFAIAMCTDPGWAVPAVIPLIDVGR